MTANSPPDDARPDGDAFDRVIDDAIEAMLRVGRVDLRAQVLARLDNPIEERPSPRFVLFRPALLPVAGAVLLVIGVAATWRIVDGQLSRAGAPLARTYANRTSVPTSPSATTVMGAVVPARPMAGPGDGATVASRAATAPTRRGRRVIRDDERIVAASFLAMDALSRPKAMGADVVIAGDEDAGPFFPGAPAGDLGDPIRMMPLLRPLVIPPLVAAPIVDAPPVSTMAKPVSTLSTDEISRDRPDPGKPGGVRP